MNDVTRAALRTDWFAVVDVMSIRADFGFLARAALAYVDVVLDLPDSAVLGSAAREALQQATGHWEHLATQGLADDPALVLVLPLLTAVRAALDGDLADVRASRRILERFLTEQPG